MIIGLVPQSTLRRACLGGLILSAAVAPAQAAQTGYGIGYAGEYSSNIGRASTNPESEWINILVAGMTYIESSSDISARATVQGQLRDYADDAFADEAVGMVDASLLWSISPGRLTWTVEDAFREVTLNPTVASTPANRAGANVFNTGPDFRIQFSPVHALSLGARYGNVYVGSSDLDNNRYSGTAQWSYQPSSTLTTSLILSQLRVNYDSNAVNDDFRRDDVFLRLQRRYPQSELVVDAGKTNIKRDRFDEVDGSLARLSLRRALSTTTSFGLSLTREFQDSGSDLLDSITDPGLPIGGIAPPSTGTDVITNDIFTSKRVDAFFLGRGARVNWSTRVNTRALDFETSLQDRREAGGRFDVGYFYSPLTGITAFGELLKTNYLDSTRQDKDFTVGLRFSYQAQRYLNYMAEARRIQRDSTDLASEFVDKRVLFSIMYTTGPLYQPLVR